MSHRQDGDGRGTHYLSTHGWARAAIAGICVGYDIITEAPLEEKLA